jgi:hypothetical protein
MNEPTADRHWREPLDRQRAQIARPLLDSVQDTCIHHPDPSNSTIVTAEAAVTADAASAVWSQADAPTPRG